MQQEVTDFFYRIEGQSSLPIAIRYDACVEGSVKDSQPKWDKHCPSFNEAKIVGTRGVCSSIAPYSAKYRWRFIIQDNNPFLIFVVPLENERQMLHHCKIQPEADNSRLINTKSIDLTRGIQVEDGYCLFQLQCLNTSPYAVDKQTDNYMEKKNPTSN